jgi:hypothetical protein
MLAEIFMLKLESAFRASEDAARSKRFRFVPLPKADLPDYLRKDRQKSAAVTS